MCQFQKQVRDFQKKCDNFDQKSLKMTHFEQISTEIQDPSCRDQYLSGHLQKLSRNTKDLITSHGVILRNTFSSKLTFLINFHQNRPKSLNFDQN